MPEINDVLPGEIILASYNNDVKDRSVQRYVDEAARDAAEPLPEVGEVSYLTSEDRFEVFNGTSWTWLFPGDNGAEYEGTLSTSGGITINGILQEVATRSIAIWNGDLRFRLQSFTGQVRFKSEDGTGGDPARPMEFWVGGIQVMTWALDKVSALVDFSVKKLIITDTIEIPEADSFTIKDDDGDTFFSIATNGATTFYDRSGSSPADLARLRALSGMGDNTGSNSNTLREILVGTSIPDNAIGKNGDVYLRYQA